MMTNIIHITCLVLLVPFLLLKSRLVQSQDLYASLFDMEPLLSTHKNIIDVLHDYINNEKMQHQVLNTYLSHYRKEHEMAIADISRYLENPIRAFRLIKRLTTDLNLIEKTVNTNSAYNKILKMKYPLMKDLIGSVEAITRLRDIYRLNITELADGILNGGFSQEKAQYTESVMPMSASDCYHLGMILIHKVHDFKNGLHWLIEAYNRFHTAQDEEHNFAKVDIILGIAFGYHMLDDVTNALKWTKMLVSEAPSDNLLDVVKDYEDILAKKEDEKRRNLNISIIMDVERMELILPTTSSRIHTTYGAACRGELEVPRQTVKRLKCRYLTENHPFLKLAPIKMEQIFLEPEVLLFHEVMSNQEIELIKELAKPMLKHVEISSDNELPVTLRTSKTAWLKDDDSDVVARVSRRISDLTGLKIEAAKNLQVDNYGFGGYYSSGHDVQNNTSIRMATVLFYMSDVAQGGATVFPELGLSVFPVRGAALFWRNLHPSGEGDEATLHAVCPVLRGDKWVSSKWIQDHGEKNKILKRHNIRRPVAKSLAC